MIPKAGIETRRQGETLIVRVRYWTPEWVRFIEAIRPRLTLFLWGGLTVLGWRYVLPHELFRSDNDAFLAAMMTGSGAFLLSWLVNNTLSQLGGGYCLQPRGNAALTVRLSRQGVSWQQGLWRRETISRKEGEIRLFPRPHRLGPDEDREAHRRGDACGRSYAYRDAWEIWLQAGERFYCLAAVSREADADAIARRLQAADAEVTRPQRRERRAA